MVPSKTYEEYSPLDQIRQAEAEITRRIVAAREAAERAEAHARAEAENLKIEARKAGAKDGQAQCDEIISRAKEEAEMFIAQAHTQASRLRRAGQSHMHEVVNRAVSIILGLLEGSKHEHRNGSLRDRESQIQPVGDYSHFAPPWVRTDRPSG